MCVNFSSIIFSFLTFTVVIKFIITQIKLIIALNYIFSLFYIWYRTYGE